MESLLVEIDQKNNYENCRQVVIKFIAGRKDTKKENYRISRRWNTSLSASSKVAVDSNCISRATKVRVDPKVTCIRHDRID